MSESRVALSDILPLLACPRCSGTPLAAGAQEPGRDAAPADLSFSSCGTRYPHVGGVACIVDEPAGRVARWRENLGALHLRAEQSIAALADEQRMPALLPLTRARLAEQIRVTIRLVEEVDEASIAALGTPRPPTWGWPNSDENARALACVEKVLSPPPAHRSA